MAFGRSRPLGRKLLPEVDNSAGLLLGGQVAVLGLGFDLSRL